MPDDPHENTLDDPRFQSLLVSCLEALERGELLDKERLQAEYPEFADELSEFLEDRDRLVKMASAARNGDDGIVSDPDAPTIAAHGQEAPLASGTRVRYFGDYELLEEIARGGMGIVYKARQVSLNRIVAVKMILAGQLASEDDVKRFHTEAEAAANLDHPGIVPIFEVGQHDSLYYFSMGFVDGESLARKLANDGPLAARRAAELTKAVAQAVHYAHEQGVIHRDLKPANVLLDEDGQPRITDFGLAKRVDVDSSLTAMGQILGTPSYMPPEQAAGNLDQVAKTSDVYSLGAILYAALTGRPPFQADNVIDTLTQVTEQEPIGPCQLNSAIPRDLETICLKCLEKEARRRFGSAQELADELQRFLKGEPIQARPLGRLNRTWRWCKRQPLVAGLILTIAISLITGTAVSSYFAFDARRQADKAEDQSRLVSDLVFQAMAHIEMGRPKEAETTLARLRRIMKLQTRPNSGILPNRENLAETLVMEDISELIKRLEDQNPKLRRAAATALGKLGAQAKQAVPALADTLQDDDKHVRQAAATALGEIGPEAKLAVPALVRSLNTGFLSDRKLVMTALAKIGPGAKLAVPALIERLTDGGGNQDLAAIALGKIGSAAVPDLIEVLDDDNRRARTYALIALGHIGPEAKSAIPILVKAVQQDREIRWAAANALALIGPDAVGPLAKLLENDESRVRSAAANALGKIGPAAHDAIAQLIKTTKDKAPSVRMAAADALWKVGRQPEPAVSTLVELMEIEYEFVIVTEMLGVIGKDAKAAVPSLREALNVEGEVAVRVSAAEALWRVTRQSEEALPVLVKVIKDKTAVSRIIQIREGDTLRIRSWAAYALGEMGSEAKAAVPALVQALRDEDEWFRRTVAMALVPCQIGIDG